MAEQKRNTRNSKSTKIQPVNDYGRIQPQAPELEEAVLGALMIEKDAYSLVSEILRPESFYERRHQLIYSAITDLAVNQYARPSHFQFDGRTETKPVRSLYLQYRRKFAIPPHFRLGERSGIQRNQKTRIFIGKHDADL